MRAWSIARVAALGSRGAHSAACTPRMPAATAPLALTGLGAPSTIAIVRERASAGAHADGDPGPVPGLMEDEEEEEVDEEEGPGGEEEVRAGVQEWRVHLAPPASDCRRWAAQMPRRLLSRPVHLLSSLVGSFGYSLEAPVYHDEDRQQPKRIHAMP